MRRHDRAVPPAIGARRFADNSPEGSAVGPKAGETDREADVGDGAVSLTQQEHRALNSPPLQVAVGRLAEDGAETAAEVGWRDVGHRSDRSHVERLGVGTIHCVSGAEQAPVEIFNFAAHPPTLRDTVPSLWIPSHRCR